MATALKSKPGITGATSLSIPKDWDPAWFRNFIANMLKGADVRNAVGANGITVSGTIASPYATITVGGSSAPLKAPIIINRSDGVTAGTTFGANGNVTIAAPSSGDTLTVNTANNYRGITINAPTGFASIALAENGVNKWQMIDNLSVSGRLSFYSAGTAAETLGISAGGNVTIAVPSSGDAFTASGVVAGNSYAATLIAGTTLGGSAGALKVVGVAAGSAVMNFTAQGTTGVATPTFANNKPGANSSCVGWLPVGVDGVQRYIPYW